LTYSCGADHWHPAASAASRVLVIEPGRLRVGRRRRGWRRRGLSAGAFLRNSLSPVRGAHTSGEGGNFHPPPPRGPVTPRRAVPSPILRAGRAPCDRAEIRLEPSRCEGLIHDKLAHAHFARRRGGGCRSSWLGHRPP